MSDKQQCRSHVIEYGLVLRCQGNIGHVGAHEHQRGDRKVWQRWAWDDDYEVTYESGGED